MTTIATTAATAVSGSAGRAWTEQAVRGLGLTTDVETAAEILGIGRTKAYEMVREGNFPVPILRIGRRVLVPTPSILTLLGA